METVKSSTVVAGEQLAERGDPFKPRAAQFRAAGQSRIASSRSNLRNRSRIQVVRAVEAPSPPTSEDSPMPFDIPVRAFRRAFAASALASTTLAAQQTNAAHQSAPVPAHRLRSSGPHPISIDGRLDEEAWKQATPITELRQQRPVEGGAPTLATEVRILYDDEALYVGARMSDPMGAAGIRAPLARRDQLLASNGNNGSFNSLTTDKLAIVLDPYHNHLDEIWFEINPAGVRGDQFNGDPSWDPVWEGEARTDATGWTAELRIPYSQLRFSRDSVQTWGLQVVAHRRPAQRAGHVVVPEARRERRARLLRPPAGDRRQPPAAAGRAAAVRRLEEPVQVRDSGRPVQRFARHEAQRRRGHQVQPHVEPHPRRDDQSRLRPGRGRSGHAQPLGVRDVLRGEAPLLRRQPRTRSTSAEPAACSAATSPGSACCTRGASAGRRSSTDG